MIHQYVFGTASEFPLFELNLDSYLLLHLLILGIRLLDGVTSPYHNLLD